MDKQRQNDQLEPTYSSSFPIRDVALKTCWKQWTIGRGGERGSGISMLMAQLDDDEIGPSLPNTNRNILFHKYVTHSKLQKIMLLKLN